MPRRATGHNSKRLSGNMLGKRIRDIRMEKNFTIQYLADAVGVQTNHINQLESGDRTPSFSTLIHITNALGVSADELLYGYLTHPDSRVIDDRISRKLQGASEQQLRRIEAHIQLELSLDAEFNTQAVYDGQNTDDGTEVS